MRRLQYTFIFLLGCAALAPAYSDPLFEAQYKGNFGKMSANSTRTLEQIDGDRYQFQSIAKSTFASLVENSEFDNKESGFRAIQYRYRRNVIGFKSIQTLTFDWQNMSVSYERKDRPKKNTTYSIDSTTLDPALYQLQMQKDAYLGATEFHYHFAKQGRIKDLDFKVSGKVDYTIGSTTYSGLRIERINPESSENTVVIIIPELMYQIADIDHRDDDGSHYLIRLVKFDCDRKALDAFYSHSTSTMVHNN